MIERITRQKQKARREVMDKRMKRECMIRTGLE